MIKIKKCPYCGSKDIVQSRTDFIGGTVKYIYKCKTCKEKINILEGRNNVNTLL